MQVDEKKKDKFKTLQHQYTIFIIIIMILFIVTAVFLIKDKDQIKKEIEEKKIEQKEE